MSIIGSKGPSFETKRKCGKLNGRSIARCGRSIAKLREISDFIQLSSKKPKSWFSIKGALRKSLERRPILKNTQEHKEQRALGAIGKGEEIQPLKNIGSQRVLSIFLFHSLLP